MNSLIELHDSNVAKIESRDGKVIVHFLPAYLHKSEGVPGFDPGTVWVQDARLFFAEASILGNIPNLPCDVMDGELIVDGKRCDNEVPVPLEVTGRSALRLIFGNIHSVTITGQGVRLKLLGEPKYVEEFNR